MDALSYQRLEFPAVLEELASHAVCGAARQAALETRPWTDADTIRHHADAVAEILGLLDSGGAMPLHGYDDCSQLIERLSRLDAYLEPAEWLRLRAAVRATRAVRRHAENGRERMPAVWDLAQALNAPEELEAAIGRVLDDEGMVRDGASADLRECRQNIRRLEREVDRVFSRLLSRHKDGDVLQEAYWTERNGRRVVPVRAGSRGKVQGIVHDTSSSGETLFVEPLDAIEPSNRLAQEHGRERQEVVRVLRELAEEGRRHCPELLADRDAMVQIDLWHARAAMAHRHGLHRPLVEDEAELRLMAAHHPLLYFREPERSVPLDMTLAPDNRALIVTGPNTGGKTTSLKTVGLLVLMAQSAIPLPAGVDSRLPVFHQVLAEIGDEQSVSQGLSTFSAHIRRISWILEHCRDRALVLLDELGKATDPLQAGALGRAILDALVERGALALVTTHLSTLKDWAHEHPAARNASYRLDPETHRPRYEMHMDTPGISEAFTIAEAEGLPHEIVEAATHALPAEERKMTELLATLSRREEELEEARGLADKERRRAESERGRLAALRAELEKTRLRQERDLETRYRDLLDKARADIEQRIANLPSRQAIAQARENLARDQKASEQRMQSLERREKRLLEKTRSAEEKAQKREREKWEPATGDWVTVGGGSQRGRVVSIDAERKRARVAVGPLEVDARLRDLARAEAPVEEEGAGYLRYRYLQSGPVETVRPELEIVGERVEPAMDRVERYLDRAILSHLEEVRIAHGYGTGALRDALRELLKRHPHVGSFRAGSREEGGGAVTVVKLK